MRLFYGQPHQIDRFNDSNDNSNDNDYRLLDDTGISQGTHKKSTDSEKDFGLQAGRLSTTDASESSDDERVNAAIHLQDSYDTSRHTLLQLHITDDGWWIDIGQDKSFPWFWSGNFDIWCVF